MEHLGCVVEHITYQNTENGYFVIKCRAKGWQFSMETFEETLPATDFGFEKYLGSGLVKGVGSKFAGRIVKQFGVDILNVIEEDPDRLLEMAGIGFSFNRDLEG